MVVVVLVVSGSKKQVDGCSYGNNNNNGRINDGIGIKNGTHGCG